MITPVKIYNDHQALSQEVSKLIVLQVSEKPASVLCLAAGDTPREAYNLLRQLASEGKADFSTCTFIGLDEWVGIPPENEGSCAFFLHTNIFSPMRIAPSQVHLFNALSREPAMECRKMDEYIRQVGGIDLMLVGVGMNGHIGFNEPGVREDLDAHVVDLDETTQSVGQKYFKEKTTLLKGVTLGFRSIMQSRKVIMMASGKKKADIIQRALEGPITTEVPASLIRRHPQNLIMLDRDAASFLEGGSS
jgi:glucosamine-6-phosphate isomerase